MFFVVITLAGLLVSVTADASTIDSPSTCNGSHESMQCRDICPPQKTCMNRGIQYACIAIFRPCVNLCVCEDGYIRNESGNCVKESECAPLCTSTDEDYTIVKSCYPDTCDSLDSSVTEFQCQGTYDYGCKCKDGLLRLIKGSPCVPKCQCPQLAGSAECNQTLEHK